MPWRGLGRLIHIYGMTMEGVGSRPGESEKTLSPGYRDRRESHVCGEGQKMPGHHPVGGTIQITSPPPRWKLLSLTPTPQDLLGSQNPLLTNKAGALTPWLFCKSQQNFHFNLIHNNHWALPRHLCRMLVGRKAKINKKRLPPCPLGAGKPCPVVELLISSKMISLNVNSCLLPCLLSRGNQSATWKGKAVEESREPKTLNNSQDWIINTWNTRTDSAKKKKKKPLSVSSL